MQYSAMFRQIVLRQTKLVSRRLLQNTVDLLLLRRACFRALFTQVGASDNTGGSLKSGCLLLETRNSLQAQGVGGNTESSRFRDEDKAWG